MPGSEHGIPDWAPTIADLVKDHGHMTGQFDKNHLGDQIFYFGQGGELNAVRWMADKRSDRTSRKLISGSADRPRQARTDA